ncbi:hypothetical protein [Aeropyrum camini]|uniref:hypothetical protein n=1 Tax=Aeropyrum camini TaxID=229980 RepID=UPI000787ED3B|nr:hypothetical protein [Aeropyrum camini]
MCRLLAGYAWSPEGARLLGRLASLVASAAEYDPYLDRIHDDARHCHGYGFILLSRKGEEAGLPFMKDSTPMGGRLTTVPRTSRGYGALRVGLGGFLKMLARPSS